MTPIVAEEKDHLPGHLELHQCTFRSQLSPELSVLQEILPELLELVVGVDDLLFFFHILVQFLRLYLVTVLHLPLGQAL